MSRSTRIISAFSVLICSVQCVAFAQTGLDAAGGDTQKSQPRSEFPVLVFESSLLPDETHPESTVVKNLKTADGSRVWDSTTNVVIKAAGATADTSTGAYLPVPMIAGQIDVQAKLIAGKSAWTALVIGRKNMTKNFWQDLGVMFYISANGRCHLFAAKKDLYTSEASVDPTTPVHVQMVLDTITRTISVNVNQQRVLDHFVLPVAARLDQIEAVGFRFQEPNNEKESAVSHFSVKLTQTASTGLVPIDLAMCFVRPESPSILQWKIQSPGPKAELPYVLRDYQGTQIETGQLQKDDVNACRLERTFPPGYFEITFPEASQSFGIVSLAPSEKTGDEFFCMDSGLSWLEMNPERRKSFIEILARCGIVMSRERLGLRSINTQPGKFNWQTGRNFETVRADYAHNNVPVLEILQGSAPYLGTPPSLARLAEVWSNVARHWTVWGGAEADNEPDLRTLPADQYVPLVKTLSYALSEGNPKIPLVAGAFARLPPGPFFETCSANGMLDDSDAISFHSYDRATELEFTVARYRDWLRESGHEAMPIWHTECGWSWPQGTDRPLTEDDERSAVEIAMKAVESKACGIARYFPFVYVYYEEGPRNFGMMGRDGTPSRCMAAYAMCARVLSGWEFYGDLTGLDSRVSRARVFKHKATNDCLAVLYTTQIDPAMEIDFPFSTRNVAGADGRTLRATKSKIPIPDGIAYVSLNLKEIHSNVSASSETTRLYQLGQHPLARKRRSSPLVFEFLYQQTPCRPSVRRYLVTAATAHELPVHVRVHNLSNTPHTFHPEISWPGFAPASSDPVTVPAMSQSDLYFSKDVAAHLDPSKIRFVTVSGRCEEIVAPLPLAIPFTLEGSLEQVLASNHAHVAYPITDLSKWSVNIAKSGTSKFDVVNDEVWRMRVSYAGGRDLWSYPRFHLPNSIDTNRFQGFAIRGRIQHAASNVAIIAESAVGKPTFWVTDLFPADGEWHVMYVPFSEFRPGPSGAGDQNTRLDPSAWKNLCIGMGGKETENELEISHLLLVGTGEQ